MQAGAPTASSRELSATQGCIHSRPAKRLKLKPQVCIPTRQNSRPAGRGSPRLAVRAAQANAAAVAVKPKEEAPASAVPVQLLTSSKSPELLRIRHSCAHIMAMAVQKLYPGTQVTIGPWIERGFYYDFDTKETLSDKDLKAIKKEMQRLIKRKLPMSEEEVTVEEARSRIEQIQEPYKMEILEGILARDPSSTITIWHIGREDEKDHWWDLCAGPHVPTTGHIAPDAIDLETVAGAYWRGDEKKAQLQRIYGTAWESADQLKAYKTFKEEAARRDHRRIGQELDLFSLNDSAGAGLVFWHPKGALVRHLIESHWKQKHIESGYQLIYTPHVASATLWQRSGHLDFYRENMFDQMQMEEEEWLVKPMNCPLHVNIYKSTQHSYKTLPLRYAELGTVYRYERSGTLHGLFRVRGFTQDDAHIFCLPDQITKEIIGVLDMVEQMMGSFGFHRLEVDLSTRPEKSVGSDDIWARAEAALGDALAAKQWDYSVDEGGGAFYGPKIDIKIEDAIGRRWQCSTIQLDFNLPERFGMTYMDADQQHRQPIMIHRAIFGSIERFFGILVENYAGAFPIWLAPVQAQILPVSPAVAEYAEEAAASMRAKGLRVEVAGGERIGKLIRNAEKAKVPVMCVVGTKEAEAASLSVRTYGPQGGELGMLPITEVVDLLQAASLSQGSF
ncbi:hypothetical protein WJX84_005920 [Apatococcus fuscideae]|uniref:threonine--tRNA ligase n=1 Tax=Apatococcus fuscideae TaxID=2026836 RepID=A0AAW1SSN4_9CHLO